MSAATQETVVLSGHIIDSLILAKVLDTILMMGGTFDLEQVSIGKAACGHPEGHPTSWGIRGRGAGLPAQDGP
jgi:hypothetical protein